MDKTENIHHLFDHRRIRAEIVKIFGEPKTPEQHLEIQREVQWCWKRIPKYQMKKDDHKIIHFGSKVRIKKVQKKILVIKKSIHPKLRKKAVKKFNAIMNSLPERALVLPVVFKNGYDTGWNNCREVITDKLRKCQVEDRKVTE